MYIIIGAKTEGYNWQTLLPVLEKSVEQSSVTEEYYPQILAALANDGAAVTGISLPQDKASLAELASGKLDKGKYVFLGLSLPADSKLLELLSNTGEAAFLLLYQKPELAMAHMLEQGKTTELAAQQWLAAANDLMTLHRHHRQSSRVLGVESAIQSPEVFFNLCKQHFGLVGKPKSLASVCSEIKIETPDTLHVLIAKQLLQQSEEVAFLANELAASTTPLDKSFDEDDGDIRLDLDKLLHQQAQLSKEKQELAEENELLLVQLHHLQEELESYYLKSQGLQQKNSRLEDRVASESEQEKLAQMKITQAQDKSSQLQRTLDLVETKRKQTQEKVDQLQGKLNYEQAKSRQLLKSLVQTQKIAGQKHKQLELIQQTSIYRLVRPFIKLQQSLAESKTRRRNLQLIEQSGYFDSGWYAENYSDVKQANIAPAMHYLLYGGFERRDPSPRFSSRGYLLRYPEVAISGINPLVHYLCVGEKEGRSPK